MKSKVEPEILYENSIGWFILFVGGDEIVNELYFLF